MKPQRTRRFTKELRIQVFPSCSFVSFVVSFRPGAAPFAGLKGACVQAVPFLSVPNNRRRGSAYHGQIDGCGVRSCSAYSCDR